MSPEVWDKILKFIKRTGERAIVADSKMDEVFVVTTLNDYEQKVLNKSDVKELTEEQLLDRINQDLAIWQSNQSQENIDVDVLPRIEVVEKNESDDEERYYVEPSE